MFKLRHNNLLLYIVGIVFMLCKVKHFLKHYILCQTFQFISIKEHSVDVFGYTVSMRTVTSVMYIVHKYRCFKAVYGRKHI